MRRVKFSNVPGASGRDSAAEGLGDQPLGAANFAHLMAALGPFEPEPLLACAVSGGADSLALLFLAVRWAKARQGQVLAFTVDHGLRPESSQEARYVGEVAVRLGARHRTLRWEFPPRAGALQVAARRARLRLLAEACREEGCLHLLLAHHRDDQLETFLLRLSRKSDLDGLAAMAPQRRFSGIRLLRPLLRVPKVRLEATLREAGLSWIEDPSNQDLRHERVKVRKLLARPEVPREEFQKAVHVFGRLRGWTEEAMARSLAQSAAFCPGGYVMIEKAALADLPDPLGLRVLARCLQAVGGGIYPPRGGSLLRLLNRLKKGSFQAATLGGCRLLSYGPHWLLVREWRTIAEVPIRPGESRIWDRRFRVTLSKELPEDVDPEGFSLVALGEADRSHLGGRRDGHHIPGAARAALPALCYLDALVSVPHLKQYQRGYQQALHMAAAETAVAATKLDFTSLIRVGILPLENEARP